MGMASINWRKILWFFIPVETHMLWKAENIINSNEICNKDKIKTITFIESYASLFWHYLPLVFSAVFHFSLVLSNQGFMWFYGWTTIWIQMLENDCVNWRSFYIFIFVSGNCIDANRVWTTQWVALQGSQNQASLFLIFLCEKYNFCQQFVHMDDGNGYLFIKRCGPQFNTVHLAN